MSGIGPAMDMAMETARDERATAPAVVSASKTQAAASAHDARASQSATDTASKPDRTRAATRVETESPDTATETAAAPATDVANSVAAGVAQAASTHAPEPAANAGATSEVVAPQADAATGTASSATVASIPAPATPAKTFATTQAARPMPAASPADAGSLGGTVFALLLVVGLILALGWLAKRMPGFGRGASNNGLRMVASLAIGARERVVVVEVGTTQLLLGVGPGGTRTLHTLDEPLPEAGPAQAPQFAQLLAQHFGKKA